MLEELERTNLFVVPLDEQQQWYRYHDLFRETLRARLYASQPELVPLLHARADRFYEAAGRPCGRPLYTRWLRLTNPLPPP